jgi:ATP-dependent helicase YprA (DUF1998 family)
LLFCWPSEKRTKVSHQPLSATPPAIHPKQHHWTGCARDAVVGGRHDGQGRCNNKETEHGRHRKRPKTEYVRT